MNKSFIFALSASLFATIFLLCTDESISTAPTPDRKSPRAARQPNTNIRSDWQDEMRGFRKIAGRDLDDAVDAAYRLSSKEERLEALSVICFETVDHHPIAALDLAMKHDLGNADGFAEIQILEKLASRWAASDVRAARAWALKLPVENARSDRDQILSTIAVVFAEEAPEEAATWITEDLVEGPYQDRAAAEIAAVWGRIDDTAARRWVEGFPESPLRAAALRKIISQPTQ